MGSIVIKKLNKFTTLPVLIDLLHRKKITLIDPKLWEDKNDTKGIFEYKKSKHIKNLFALCFSYSDETVHLWKAFSNGPYGCCIEFNYDLLLKEIKKAHPLFKHGPVEYKKLKDIEYPQKRIHEDKIPFIKRWPYRCEEEYRIMVEIIGKKSLFHEVRIPLEVINKITISQHMSQQVFNSIKKYLEKIIGTHEIKINRSTLYENKRWIKGLKVIVTKK